MAARLPSSIEKTAITASNGTQPEANARHAPLPSAPANPTIITLPRMKKLATLEPDAMSAALGVGAPSYASGAQRSEEHTSELQSLTNLVCRLLLQLPPPLPLFPYTTLFRSKTAITASNGTQPEANARHAPLPSAPANPTIITLPRMKKLATLEPDAMSAALGVGAPSYASGAQ